FDSSCSLSPSTTEIAPLSLHDALPISGVTESASTCVTTPPPQLPAVVVSLYVRADGAVGPNSVFVIVNLTRRDAFGRPPEMFSLDRKSTRLNSSHEWISYAVFCLKKKI